MSRRALSLRVNPVLRRELLERWRSRRAPITLTLYLAVLGGILYLLYRIGLSVLGAQGGFDGGFGPGGPDVSLLGPALGRFLFESLLFFVLLLVLFVAPGYAAAQLSGERERRTLALLQVTLLSPTQIVLGKLGASVAWLTLLVVATLPLGAAAFFLGGVTPVDLLRGIGFILVIAVAVAAMAIGASAVARRTTGAIVLTYGLVLALVGGSLMIAGAQYVVRESSGQRRAGTPPVALYANPVFGLSDAVRATPVSERFRFGFSGFDLPSPLALMAEALPRDLREEERFAPQPFDAPLPGGGVVDDFGDPFSDPLFDEGLAPGDAAREPVWLRVMGLYVAAAVLALLLARQRLAGRQVSARIVGRRRRRRDRATPPGGAAPAEPESLSGAVP
jgi:ABC-type transport system involved in multi-copper enzyme maturation permease subunit